MRDLSISMYMLGNGISAARFMSQEEVMAFLTKLWMNMVLPHLEDKPEDSFEYEGGWA